MKHDEPTMPPTELEVHESCPDCTADKLCYTHGKDPLLDAFYRLTIKERDYERVKTDRLTEENERLRGLLRAVEQMLSTPYDAKEQYEKICEIRAALAGRESKP